MCLEILMGQYLWRILGWYIFKCLMTDLICKLINLANCTRTLVSRPVQVSLVRPMIKTLWSCVWSFKVWLEL